MSEVSDQEPKGPGSPAPLDTAEIDDGWGDESAAEPSAPATPPPAAKPAAPAPVAKPAAPPRRKSSSTLKPVIAKTPTRISSKPSSERPPSARPQRKASRPSRSRMQAVAPPPVARPAALDDDPIEFEADHVSRDSMPTVQVANPLQYDVVPEGERQTKIPAEPRVPAFPRRRTKR